ncbi:MAG: hypothetical protein HKN04_10160 [Rhodothermaceae bacterium]|nr:hypothetical protein [Rhodothermaceae bacterium]
MGATNKKQTKTKTAPAAPPDPATAEVASLGDLERVRSILFGAQSREFDRRIAQLEGRLERAIEAMREALDRRVEALETFAKEELEATNKRLSDEQEQRTEGHEQLTGKVSEVTKALKEHRAQLDERIAESEHGLRTRILDQSKTLTDDLHQKADALTAMTEQHIEALRTDKTDRLALADLFDGLAMRLRDDFMLPEEE